MPEREEKLILDPAEVALADRAELDLHADNIRVLPEGIDWGTAEIEAYMAQQQMGESVIDYRLPNRIIKIPLILGATGDFDAARLAIQAKVSRINEEGGWLKRELIGGSYGEAGSRLFCDLVKATLKMGGSIYVASSGFDPDAELELEALPDFYGEQETLGKHEGTGDLSFTEQIKGNLPARVDIEVTNQSVQDQRGLGWCLRCTNYDSAATASWAYEAEALTPLDIAAEFSVSGASGGKVIRHANLGTDWTPVLSTNLKGGGYLTHAGVYDVWVRAYATSEQPPWLRLAYDVGDMAGAVVNEQVQIPGFKNFYLVNLGQINLRRAPMGQHRWQGTIQARGLSGGEVVYIDRLYFFDAVEGSGVLTSSMETEIGISAYSGRDEFRQTAGALTGKSAAVGGTYAALSKSATTDFEVDATNHLLARTAKEDKGTLAGGLMKGRAVGLALSLGATVAKVDFHKTYEGEEHTPGLLVRAVDTSNFLAIFGNTKTGNWVVYQVVGNVATGLMGKVLGKDASTGWRTLTVAVQGGFFEAYLSNYSGSKPLFSGYSAALTEALASGGVYVYDEYRGTAAVTRQYDNLRVWSPQGDAVIYGSRAAHLTTKGHFREDPTGAALGPVAYQNSDLPRLPVSGPEERPVEVALKVSRGDFSALPDAGIDAVAAQIIYRPCWSYVPSP